MLDYWGTTPTRLNPIIYNIFNMDFMEGFKRVLTQHSGTVADRYCIKTQTFFVKKFIMYYCMCVKLKSIL